MNRRRVVSLAATVILVGPALGRAIAQNPPKESETSPHAAALQLVFETQASRIREVEKGLGDWWNDTFERSWTVKRPFGPGYIDSRHWFNVIYRINGQMAAAWFVNTRDRDVQESPDGK
jgi:hypothetical protein